MLTISLSLCSCLSWSKGTIPILSSAASCLASLSGDSVRKMMANGKCITNASTMTSSHTADQLCFLPSSFRCNAIVPFATPTSDRQHWFESAKNATLALQVASASSAEVKACPTPTIAQNAPASKRIATVVQRWSTSVRAEPI